MVFPEINVQGNGQNITSGDMMPSTADFTEFRVCSGNLAPLVRSFTIQNTGAATLNVSAIVSSHPDFSISGITLPTTVASGSSTTFSVAYSYSGATANATISVTNDDADENPYTFAVMGTTNPAITSTLSTTNNTCNGACNGTATVTAAGGAGGFTYAWTTSAGGQTTPTATGLCYGAYNVTMTDAAGCFNVRQFINIYQPTAIQINATSVGTTCANDGQASVAPTGGAGGYTYAWSTGATTASITGLAGGLYGVTVTDAAGCSVQTNVNVTTTCFTITATPTNITTCTNTCTGSATVNANGGVQPYTYLWSNGATTQTITGLCKATYTVTVTDANGAVRTASAFVNFIAMSALVTSTSVSCNSINNVCNGTATINAIGGQTPYTYQWNANAGSQTTQTATGLCYGAYSVTVTSANGCSVVRSSINILQPPAISLTMGSTPSSCAIDGTASVTQSNGTAPYSYLWTNGGTTNTITGLPAGNYRVTVTDINGCSRSASVTVANSCGAKPVVDTDNQADIAILDAEENDNTSNISNDINETLRLNDFSLVEVFNVYPNPNNGQFTIDIQLAAETDARIRIQDALGRTLYEENVQGQFFQMPISANQWSAGAYFVQLISAQGQTTRKVIITK